MVTRPPIAASASRPGPPHAGRLWLLIALMLTSLSVLAQGFGFPFPGGSGERHDPRLAPGPSWQFRPPDSSNARGIPPGYGSARPSGQAPAARMPSYPPGAAGGYPPAWPGPYGQYGQYGYPYGRQPQAQPASRPPRLEVEAGNLQPYVQEAVLLRLRVVSERNLATATPELPSTSDWLLQLLDGPNTRSRTAAGGHREIVNEFLYSLIPLHAGELSLPSLRVRGEFSRDNYGYGGDHSYEATSTDDLQFQVRPAMASVRPWLPLQNLALKATLDSEGEVEEGQPVTLVLELQAAGAVGSQLPSLESYLHSADFRVYREQTLTEGKLSPNGRYLEGKRSEYYTLVPHSGGKLYLPEIRLPWWNVTTGTREYASLPIHLLQVEGESGPFGLSSSSAQARRSSGAYWFWLPLIGLVLLLLGYWGGVWYKIWSDRRPADREALGAQLGRGLRAMGTRLEAGLDHTLSRLAPAPVLRRFGRTLSRALPPSNRFLHCVRLANREPEPERWAQRFQEAARRHLDLDARMPLPGLCGQILRLRPGADRDQIERLLRQLDGALYGRQDIDFQRWKKQFQRQIGRGRGLLRGYRHLRPRLQRPRLPELNPRP